MSEYQYYEFRAVDRRLTTEEQKELRRYSTRASITSTSFTNEYHWGSFKGDEVAWMERYFDAYLYYADWGSRTIKLRIPRAFFRTGIASEYLNGDYIAFRKTETHVVLTIATDGDEIDSNEAVWYDEDESRHRGSQLNPYLDLRDEIMNGDLRSLYLAWLLNFNGWESASLLEESIEPPMPPGLRNLSNAQRALIDFFSLDQDLLAAAAETSPPIVYLPASDLPVRNWVAELSSDDRDDLLVRLITDERPGLARELLARARRTFQPEVVIAPQRTIIEILEARGRQKAARKARERAAEERRREAAEKMRNAFLDTLVGTKPSLWRKAEALSNDRKQTSYEEAAQILLNLRDLALRSGDPQFAVRLAAFRLANAKRPTLIERLKRAGL